MPEGPEVRIIADQLHQLLKKQLLYNILIHSGPFATSNEREYTEFRHDVEILRRFSLKNRVRIDYVRCHGKLIYFHLTLLTEDGTVEAHRYIISHLGMTGHWRLDRGSHTHISLVFKADAESPEREVYFDDSRRFGLMMILTPEQMRDRLSTMGPDVLSSAFTAAIMSKALKTNNKPLGVALLDQSVLSGIGNYLRADILYYAKLDPRRKFSDLESHEIRALYTAITTITRRSYEARGTTIQTYRDIKMEPGNYDPLIYGKEKDAEGNPVKLMTLGGRTMHWVPAVQTNTSNKTSKSSK